jgi:hypothetical protein
MHDAALFPISLKMPELRLEPRVLAQLRVTQFLCRIPNKGGAYVPIGKAALCSGKSRKKTGRMSEKADCTGMVSKPRDLTDGRISYTLNSLTE